MQKAPKPSGVERSYRSKKENKKLAPLIIEARAFYYQIAVYSATQIDTRFRSFSSNG